MKNQLFRGKSLDRISSPEQLNDYIRVTNPGVWIILLGILFILIGICVWGVFGRLDTLLSVGAVTENGQTVCYIKENDFSKITAEMTVRVEEEEYKIDEISLQPMQVDDAFSEYLRYVGGLTQGEWVYSVTLQGVHGTDGAIFQADVVIESIAPMTFVLN